MNEDDFQLLRAKRQIQREAAFALLVAGVAVAAALRFADIDLPFMYPLRSLCCLFHWSRTRISSPIWGW